MKRLLKQFHDFLARRRLLPSFDEDTVFLLTASVLLVIFLDPDARAFAEMIRAGSSKAYLVILLGMGFSIYTAFFTKFKTETQKFYMFWFAIIVNFFSAFAALDLMDSAGSVFSYIIPGIAILIFILMLVFWYSGVLDTGTMPHRSSSYSNIIYGTVIVFIFVLLADRFWGFEWPDILTSAVAYATLFNKAVVSHLPRIIKTRDQEIERIDASVEKGIDHALVNLNQGRDMLTSVLSGDAVEDVIVPDKHADDVEGYMAGWLAKHSKQDSLAGKTVAVVYNAVMSEKRHWFSRTREQQAIIVDVFPPNDRHGYKFCQRVEYNNEDTFARHKGLVYISKINNIIT